MSQAWTIASSVTGEVLCPSFSTPDTDAHPKDWGWAWDDTTQVATRIDRIPDPVSETFANGAWGPNVVELRAQRWSAIKARRDQAEWGGCNTPRGRVDTDQDSQRKVSGAVQMAMIAQAAGQPFVIDWTMHDNSTVEHDAMAMIAMGVAVGQHVARCHAVALAKRIALDAAADAGAIAAIDIDGGWPDAEAPE